MTQQWAVSRIFDDEQEARDWAKSGTAIYTVAKWPDPNEPYWNARAEEERAKLSAIWQLCHDREQESDFSVSRMADGRPFPAVVMVEELRQIIRGSRNVA